MARRIELGARYAAAIRASGAKVQLLTVRPDRTSVWAQYTVLVADRDGVQERMRQAGVPTAVHYPKPLHQQPAYARAFSEATAFPVSEALAREVLSLPMISYLDEIIQRMIAAAVQGAARTRRCGTDGSAGLSRRDPGNSLPSRFSGGGTR